MYVQTYFLFQLRKMVILLISSYCKMCTLPTLRSRVCLLRTIQTREIVLLAIAMDTFYNGQMSKNEQNQHFAELRQKICLHIYVVVLLTCLPSLDGILKRFVTKEWHK